uniref:protein SODIUM POTASSIUM ROOT DEFECTIVE 1 n=1 Tax=Erigeron canadensis TaxID=72917 RepID=UPI001CB8E88E|nr:protein SODIUM POTASSIUM ROOT DEFECTIVE 1 [Erigeron canadensis]
MKIKTTEFFCASPASTAICTTMNQHAMVRRGGGSSTTPRPINHRHYNYYNNHYQFDFGDKPKFKAPTIPCTSQQHIDPKPYTAYLQKNRKSTSSATTTTTTLKNIHVTRNVDDGVMLARRKSSADLIDRNNITTRGSSSRYLLNNNPIFFDELKDNKGAIVVSEPVWPDYDSPSVTKKSCLSSSRPSNARGDESPALVKSRSSSIRLGATVESPRHLISSRSSARSRDQVVELRVSIHCKGCEGKVRKHISRMEGVKSFHIDLESKKVTVIGDVTPLSVLSSISKVKNAQLWPSPSSSSSSPFIAIGF